jgi:hypothetical protein
VLSIDHRQHMHLVVGTVLNALQAAAQAESASMHANLPDHSWGCEEVTRRLARGLQTALQRALHLSNMSEPPWLAVYISWPSAGLSPSVDSVAPGTSRHVCTWYITTLTPPHSNSASPTSNPPYRAHCYMLSYQRSGDERLIL